MVFNSMQSSQIFPTTTSFYESHETDYLMLVAYVHVDTGDWKIHHCAQLLHAQTVTFVKHFPALF